MIDPYDIVTVCQLLGFPPPSPQTVGGEIAAAGDPDRKNGADLGKTLKIWTFLIDMGSFAVIFTKTLQQSRIGKDCAKDRGTPSLQVHRSARILWGSRRKTFFLKASKQTNP